jgi:transcription elongation factor Elf1
LSEPIDIYSEWIDAADSAEKEQQATRRPAGSSSRAQAAAIDSDEE